MDFPDSQGRRRTLRCEFSANVFHLRARSRSPFEKCSETPREDTRQIASHRIVTGVPLPERPAASSIPNHDHTSEDAVADL
jgi:hypothetical protein